jgi:hypothetical protein
VRTVEDQQQKRRKRRKVVEGIVRSHPDGIQELIACMREHRGAKRVVVLESVYRGA